MPLMFQGTYGESVDVSGLHYLALGVGVTGSSQINARFTDYIYKYLKAKNGGAGEPEYRLRWSILHTRTDDADSIIHQLASMVPGTIFLPVGLLITGWAVQAHVHWIVTDIVGSDSLHLVPIRLTIMIMAREFSSSARASSSTFRQFRSTW
jgi:hypothetical protein